MTSVNYPLKIIFIYDCIYPESLGGVEFRNFQLAKFLSQQGHSVSLAGWTNMSEYSLERVNIFPLPGKNSLYNQAGKRNALTSLKFALACTTLPLEKFDYILTDNIPYIHLFFLSLICLIKRKPLLITWHEYWGKYWRKYIGGISWLIYFIIELITAQLGKKVIAVSNFTAKRLEQYRLFNSTIKIIPNGVNLQEIIAATEHISRNGAPFIYAGRLMAEKRIDLLLHAVAKLYFPENKIILTIIGDGPDRNYLENLAFQLGINHQVEFKGRLTTIEEVWQEIARAKIAIQPSEREGFGIFPLEAMAIGTPVIYCDSPESAVGEIVRHDLEGICVSPNSQDLAIAMKDLLSNAQKWSKLSENARIRSQTFDWNHISHQLINQLLNYD